MKRKPIVIALVLLLVVGAALWGVNYRLDHPPLTQADKEFRALVAGADSARISQSRNLSKAQIPNTKNFVENRVLNREQILNLIKEVRFTRKSSPANQGNFLRSGRGIISNIVFQKEERTVATCFVYRSLEESTFHIALNQNRESIYEVNPRFNKRLNRTLDAYLPQTLRP